VLQPAVGLGLHSNTPPNLSIPCSTSPFVYFHLSQVRRHVIQPSRFWSSSASCCIFINTLHFNFHNTNLPTGPTGHYHLKANYVFLLN
jgi:hypothetical protein